MEQIHADGLEEILLPRTLFSRLGESQVLRKTNDFGPKPGRGLNLVRRGSAVSNQEGREVVPTLTE